MEANLMRAGMYIGPGRIRNGNLPIPTLSEKEALIKVRFAGICGTDMMVYAGKHPRVQAPRVLGHEFSGVVTDISETGPFQPGDRVVPETIISCGTCEACQSGQYHVCKTLRAIGIDEHGGFAEYVAVPIEKLHRIPETLSDAHAALTEPLAVAVHTIRRSALRIGQNTAILGCGPIGLLIGIVAKNAGANEVIVVDVSCYRLNKAKQFGLTAIDARSTDVVNEIRSRTGGIGADIVFEAAGNQTTVNQMAEIVRIQGTVVAVSLYKQSPTVPLTSLLFKEATIRTTRCYAKEDFKTAIDLMASGKINVNAIISHQLPLEELAAGFETMENPEASMKILISPDLKQSL